MALVSLPLASSLLWHELFDSLLTGHTPALAGVDRGVDMGVCTTPDA